MDEYFELLKQYNLWDGKELYTGVKREQYISKLTNYLGNRLIKVLVGQRRVGKSFILRQLAKQLIETGAPPENIFLLNLEMIAFDFVKDYRDLQMLLLTYINNVRPQGRIYLFIDEIQNVEGWEKLVNSYSQDYTAEYELFITGSNSKMLSGELSTLLSGRYLKFEIMPFSFHEYSTANNLPPSKETYLKYIEEGGLPEFQTLSTTDMRANYVNALKDTIILRDVVQRYQIKDVDLLVDLVVHLANNTSTLFSAGSLFRYYKGLGRKVSFDKISAYLQYLCETFFIHRVERYSIKGKEVIAGLCKYYVNDISFSRFLQRGRPHGMGYDLENMHYLALRRAGYDIYIGDIRNREVDFIASRGDRKIYIQSTYMLVDEATIEREYASLEAIADNYEKIVVSMDDIPLPSREGIKHIRAWELDDYIK